MNFPSKIISPTKIKDKSYLLYKIQQKHEHWNVAKCALLIGAGCSYPTLPLGSGVINFCQRLCYIRDIFPQNASAIITEFFKNPDSSLLVNFITSMADGDVRKTFDQYIVEKEELLNKTVKNARSESLKKIPNNFHNPIWEDFESHFLNDARYGFWMNTFSDSPRERQRLIESLVENCNPSGAYIILALLIEMKLLSNILTTNFDDFINDTLLYYTSTKPRFYADDEISQYITIHSPKPNIIKLHGDYRYANLKNTDKETFELSERMELKLRELLNNLDLIVVGYNGSDYSIMNVLQKVKSPDCELLWCDLDENNVHWRVSNLINNTDNSWFIKIKGFDDIVKDFYLNFVKTPPDLVKKAQERQEELTHYIKEYNKVLQDNADSPENKASLENQDSIWEIYKKAFLEKDYEPKIALFTQALNIAPRNAQILMDRGITYKMLMEYDLAMNDLNNAIEIDEKFAKAYLNRGYILEENGKYSEALRDFDKAAELGFEDKAMLFNNYAVAYRRSRDFHQAIHYAEMGLKHNPEMYFLYGTLALTYADMGEDENFYKYIELCLEKGCPIDRYLDKDHGFDRFLKTNRFKSLLAKFNHN